ncbi:MAG TPA: arginase [Candidatus Saccharimonadales bacterium]|nr:arginase [Candidatus Saccharimonadales bacterium]
MLKDLQDLTLIGVPLDLGAENLGVSFGPDAYRANYIGTKLSSAGFKVADLGNLECPDRKNLKVDDKKQRYSKQIIEVNERLAKLVHDQIQLGNKVVVLGGDHSINLGTFSGASVACKGEIGQIYLDAHGDMNTRDTTMSGNIHGMHLASLMGFGSDDLKQVFGDQTKLSIKNLLHIGGCDLDDAEVELIKTQNIAAFTMQDLLRHGLDPLFAMVNELAERVPNVWISLDLDAIDSIYAPGAGMPNPKGLTYREVVAVAEYVGKTCKVVGIDVVEYNPLNDEKHKTAELATELIAKFLGRDYSWYTNYLNKNGSNRD